MLECNNTVTLLHINHNSDDDEIECIILDNASWFKRNTITTSEKGATPVNTYESRIMTERDIPFSLGDWLVLGAVESVEKPSDVSLDKFRITAIGDNRRGTLKHWRVSGQ
jgi:hypothetical protein